MGPAGRGPGGVPRFVLALKPGAVLAILSGTLAVTTAGDTLAATATVLVAGTLTANQANQTVVAAGGPTVAGALGLTEANDTIAASGGPVIAGVLGLTEANDTLVGAGSVSGGTVSGTLALTEANDTLAGHCAILFPGAPVRDNDCLLEQETEAHDLLLEDNSGFLALEVCVEAPTLVPGGAGIPHTFTRRRWRELQMLIAAEMAAVAKAEQVTRPARREALLHAARAAAAAIDAAEIEGENKRLDALLVRNARILREAIRTNEAKAFTAAVRISREIVARPTPDEEDMIMVLLIDD